MSEITGASVSTQITPPEMWQKEFEVYKQSEDFFKSLEGKTLSAVIPTRNDANKGLGQVINIRTMSGLYGPGKQGDARFENASDFDDPQMGEYAVRVDVLRNAVSSTERAKAEHGMAHELGVGLPRELGRWYGRKKTHRLFMSFEHQGGEANTIYANERGSLDALTFADVLNVDEVTGIGSILSVMNGTPAEIRVDRRGNTVSGYAIVGSTHSLLSLKQDDDYKKMLHDAAKKGESNPLFVGGYVDIDGNFVREHKPLKHDGRGPIGSPLTPEALLGIDIAAGTVAFDITGGGSAAAAADTRKEYFQDFANFAYAFNSVESLVVAGNPDFYVVVYNVSGANRGKWNMYKCGANNGNKITVTQRLGSAASGIRATQVGNVVWDAAKNTDVHPSGSLVFPVNANGVAYGTTFGFAAGAGIRGYGLHDGKRGQETDEDGFITETYIRGYFGQRPRKDAAGRFPGFLKLKHAVIRKGIGYTPTLA